MILPSVSILSVQYSVSYLSTLKFGRSVLYRTPSSGACLVKAINDIEQIHILCQDKVDYPRKSVDRRDV